MTVTCTTFEEFLECLDAIPHLFEGTIRASVIRQPYDVERDGAPTKFNVVFQASAIAALGEEGQYLLQVGEVCGKDYEDADAERKGTERGNDFKRRLIDYAAVRSWRVLPGIIGE